MSNQIISHAWSGDNYWIPIVRQRDGAETHVPLNEDQYCVARQWANATAKRPDEPIGVLTVFPDDLTAARICLELYHKSVLHGDQGRCVMPRVTREYLVGGGGNG